MKPYRQSEIVVGKEECVDTYKEGRLRLIQSRTGYRSSIDAILLSEFVTIKKSDVIADLGTGCGVIPLLLHIAFCCEDLLSTVERLIAAGAVRVSGPEIIASGDELAMLRDPWGLAIQLVNRANPMV